jgi:hypothetical protein
MPVFDISINIYLLLALLALAMIAGFWGRSRQISKKKRRIAELEREMMQAYEELLELQKNYCELESSLKEGNSPVIPLKYRTETPIGPDQERTRKSSSTGTNGSPGGV